MHSYWWFNLDAIAVFLQIALSSTIALASALAIAAHHQSQKCAALFAPQRSLAFDFGLDEGEAHILRAARWAVRWVCRLTYASEFSLFLPAQLGLVPWLLRFAAWRVGRHRRLVRAGPSKRPQPNRSVNRTRAPK